jgi:hypothetical protein
MDNHRSLIDANVNELTSCFLSDVIAENGVAKNIAWIDKLDHHAALAVVSSGTSCPTPGAILVIRTIGFSIGIPLLTIEDSYRMPFGL